MRHTITAYIENYHDITFLVEKKGKYKAKHFYLYHDEDFVEELIVNYASSEGNCIKYGLTCKVRLCLNHCYSIIDDYNNQIPLYSGSVVRTTEFEAEFYYDGPLGFEYTKDYTIFRVWSPVAKSIFIQLKDLEGRSQMRELTYGKRGVWSTQIMGDLDKYAYAYHVKLFDKYEKVLDPYGIASDALRNYNYVVDKAKFYKIKNNKPVFSGFYTDAIIYEASVRDFTCNLSNENKGTFSGMNDSDKEKGLNYISDLGVTHLQLLPVFDFGGVDPLNKDKLYNWGYNPEQYFVPSAWYASNPDDPYSRIDEYLKMIDAAHSKGLRVVMDVVYNHVYSQENFPFEKLVPGYFYRVDLYGNYTNVSGCGNDLATEKRMCSKFIIDNLVYWAKYFNISGFRFDLMGLLDIETMNNAYIELKNIEPNIILYGEGWNMPNTIPDAYRPHSYNHYKMPNYAFFNDKYRDTIKGSQWEKTEGYIFGNQCLAFDVYNLVTGSVLDYYKFVNPNQTINYCECHDNYTLYDFAKKELKLDENKIIDGCRLALQIILISQGIPFIHAGQEFFRTKKGVENSYNSGDDVNLFDYERLTKYHEDILGFKDLIKIRKKHKVFRMTTEYEIVKKVRKLQNYCDSNSICYCLNGNGYNITVYIKNNTVENEVILSESRMIFDGRRACDLKANKYTLKNVGVYIFKQDL